MKSKQIKEQMDALTKQYEADYNKLKIQYNEALMEEYRRREERRKAKPEADPDMLNEYIGKAIKVGDFVRVKGARSYPVRQVIKEISPGYWRKDYRGRNQFHSGNFYGMCFRTDRKTKLPVESMADIRYVGNDKITHVLIGTTWHPIKKLFEEVNEHKRASAATTA